MAATFRGWTLREWGIAIQQVGFIPQNLEQADNMRNHWDRQGRPKPGSIQIIGGEYHAELEAAGNVFRWAKEAGRLQIGG